MPDKPAYQKLLIKPGSTIRLINPPPNVDSLLGGLPGDVTSDALRCAPADVVIAFANNRKELEEQAAVWSGVASDRTIVWIAYHKGTSKVKTDIHRDSINDYAKSIGMLGVAMVSIDDDWSALRLKKI